MTNEKLVLRTLPLLLLVMTQTFYYSVRDSYYLSYIIITNVVNYFLCYLLSHRRSLLIISVLISLKDIFCTFLTIEKSQRNPLISTQHRDLLISNSIIKVSKQAILSFSMIGFPTSMILLHHLPVLLL